MNASAPMTMRGFRRLTGRISRIGVFLVLLATALASADITVDVGGSADSVPVEPAESAAEEAVSEDVLAPFRASHFQQNEVERNPFWPVGWWPFKDGRHRLPREKPVSFQLEPGTFHLSSTMLGLQPLAVINGKSYGVGDRILLAVGQKWVEVRIAAVEDGAVIVRIGEGAYRISMRRRANLSGMESFTEPVDLAAAEPPRAIPVNPENLPPPPTLRLGQGLVDTTTRSAPASRLSEETAGLLNPLKIPRTPIEPEVTEAEAEAAAGNSAIAAEEPVE